MNEVFIVEARRTPFGSFGGALSDISAPDLASQVMRDLLRRSQIPATAIDEVIAGQVLQGGCGQAPARQAMRKAGLPDSVHAMTINKVCGSGLKAIMLAADSIRLGDATCVIAGGMESMSLAPYALPTLRTGQRMGHAQALDLIWFTTPCKIPTAIVTWARSPKSGSHATPSAVRTRISTPPAPTAWPRQLLPQALSPMS